MEKNVILRAKDLSKTFSNESVQQHVLRNLSLEVYKGDFTVVMGNSGSGKSTLLYALSGMDRPTLGTITYYVDDDGKGTRGGRASSGFASKGVADRPEDENKGAKNGVASSSKRAKNGPVDSGKEEKGGRGSSAKGTKDGVGLEISGKEAKGGRGSSAKGTKDGDGLEISKFSNDKLALFRRNHAGFVFQQNYLNDSMSALDNVMVSGLLKNRDRKALAEKAMRLLERVEINERDSRKFPAQLSGGQQQRVAVVRGVINSPEVLFADEPTGALNSQNTTNVLDILSELNREGQSIVMVTHTIKAAERGNRIIYLADGVISDECELGAYAGDYMDEENPDRETARKRHEKLKEFLQEMGW